ncbi:hypothetical protein SUNI508_14107, partial [Seiridium unicorne]
MKEELKDYASIVI